MPSWYDNLDIITQEVGNRFKDNETLIKQERQRRVDDNLESRALARGKSVDEIKQEEFERSVAYATRSNLIQLAKTDQSQALVSLLESASNESVPISLFADAISSQSKESFHALLDANYECDYSTPTGRRAFDAAMNPNAAYYFAELIGFGCSTDPGEYGRSMTELLMSRKAYDLMLHIPINNSNQSDFDRVFDSMISRKDESRAIKFLEHGVTQPRLTKTLPNAVRQGYTNLSQKMLEKGAGFAVDLRFGLSSSILNIALSRGNALVAIDILKRDPEYISRELDGHDVLLRSTINSQSLLDKNGMLDFLFAHGLDASKFKRQGLFQLVSAINELKPDLLKRLIRYGANPKQLFKGQSLIEFARKSIKGSSAEVIAVLKNAGVYESGIEFSRNAPERTSIANCEPQKATFDFSTVDEQMSKLELQNDKPLTKMQRCEALIASCDKVTKDLDSCINSAPVCDNSKRQELCCQGSVRDSYLEARCAGMSPADAVFRIPDQSTVYEIPIILLNKNMREQSP